jgi:hypothetical protein
MAKRKTQPESGAKTEQDRALKIIRAYEGAKSARSNVDNTFRDIERLALPSMDGSNTDNLKSAGQDDRPISSLATSEAILLGSNLYSHSYSSSDRNFALRASKQENRDLMKKWLQYATDTITEFMQNSNFSQVYGEFTRIWSNFGTGICGVEYDKTTSELVFSSIPITANVYITEDFQGRVRGFFRLLRLTADDVVNMLGYDALCPKGIVAYGDMSKSQDKFDYILSVTENPDHDPARFDIGSMKFKSEYVSVKEKRVVKRGGYRSFPYPTARFVKRHDGSPYGIGASEMALPTIRGLNTNEAQLTDSMQMEARPPTVVKDDEQLEIDEIEPNSVIHTSGEITQLRGTHNAQVAATEIERLTLELRRQYFTNVFLAVMANQNDKTATEVDALQAEQFASIAPMISRLRSEFWSPMIHRILDLLIEAGEIEPPDANIAGADFEVSYISQLDTKLELMDQQKTVQAVNAIVQMLMSAREVPELNRVLKIEDIAISFAEAHNVKYEHIVSEAERAEMDRAAEAAAAEQAALQKQEIDQKSIAPIDTTKKPEEGSPAAMQMSAAGEVQPKL